MSGERVRRILAVGVVCTACATGPRGGAGSSQPSAPDPRARLAHVEGLVSQEPAREAEAGWLRYLIASDPAGARQHFERSLRPGVPVEAQAFALCGLAELAEDRLEAGAAVGLWARALTAAPASPAAELAALRLLDLEGESPSVDAAVVGLARALPPNTAPRAARLVREAAARSIGRAVLGGEDPAQEWRSWRELGVLQRWRVGGPYAALRLYDLARPLALDGPADARAPARGPAGPSAERALEFPDGDVGLDGEPAEGDLFYAASRATLARGGEYLLWVEGAGALELRIDGSVLVSRVPYPRETPRAQVLPVRLGPGTHDVLVRFSRAEGFRFRIALVRGDGAAADLDSAAPEALTGRRAGAPCALGAACLAEPAWSEPANLSAWALERLSRDPEDAFAAFLGARAALGDDRVRGRALIAQAVSASGAGAPALALRATGTLHDPDVPERIGRARALADFEEATRKNPQLARALLQIAALQREADRHDDAAAALERAETALRDARAKPAARLLVAWGRLFEARGNFSFARARAEAAQRAEPGRCDALLLLAEVARREGSAGEQLRTARARLSCAEGPQALAALLRDRGDLAAAEAVLARLATLRPAQPQRLQQLSEVQASRRDLPRALATLRAASALSPHSVEPLRRAAVLLDLQGNPKEALRARKDALVLTPGDLRLRRQVALDEGTKLLAWSDRDVARLLKPDATSAVPPGASAVRLLDLGAVELFPDGGGVERVHTLARVLDKKGVAKFGEAQIPGDAEVLQLRTLKPDGRTLEPESIPEKETLSLPGLEPGDAVEIDYLRPLQRRGPELPGLSLASFFFRDDETPMGLSTYEVRSAGPLEVDAHHLQLAPGALRSGPDGTRFLWEARDVPPLQAEPHQPGESEFMPSVQLGTGAGEEDWVRSVGDWALLRARPGTATAELARTAGGATPRERAQAIFRALSQAVRGRASPTDFSTPAAQVLSQGRGNRLLPLKAALAAAGIPSHLVLVRLFTADPAPYRFPRPELHSYAVLRADLPDGPLWLDASWRLTPFGRLPAYAADADAWVVPEPGEKPQRIRTPPVDDDADGRLLRFELKLDTDGGAAGTGRDEQRGFDGAALKDALERLDGDQRKQAVESMLGRGLRSVTLEALSAEHEDDPEAPAALTFTLRAQLGRRDDQRLTLPASLLPERLARRWADRPARLTPLLVDSAERAAAQVRIALPEGRHLRGAPPAVHLHTPYGEYAWSAKEERGALVIEESVFVPQQRIAPADYPAFAAFARQLDDAQQAELLIAP